MNHTLNRTPVIPLSERIADIWDTRQARLASLLACGDQNLIDRLFETGIGQSLDHTVLTLSIGEYDETLHFLSPDCIEYRLTNRSSHDSAAINVTNSIVATQIKTIGGIN